MNIAKIKRHTGLYRRIIIVVAAIVAVSVVYAVYDNLLAQKQVMPIFADGIKVDEDTVSVKGYSIYLNGKKLGMMTDLEKYSNYLPYVNFYILTKADPIWASENISTDELSDSINNLENYQAELKKQLSLDTDVVRIRSMKEVVTVSRLHKAYLEDPSLVNGRKLVGGYKKALDTYREDIRELLLAVSKQFPEDQEQRFNFFASITSNQIIIHDLKLALKNADKLGQEISKRSKLLDGENLTLGKIQPSSKKVNFEEYNVPELIPKDGTLGVDEKYLSELRGPYVVRTACFSGQKDNKFMYVYDLNLYGRKVLMPKQADENYYHKVSTGDRQESGDGMYGYALYKEGNTYRCNDLSYQVDLAIIDRFQSLYKDKLSDSFSAYDRVKYSDIVGFESKYYESSYKSYRNLGVLGNYYLEAYEGLSQNEGDQTLAKGALDRYLLIRSRLSGIEGITNTTFFLNYLKDFYGTVSRSENVEKYLVTRSAYSIAQLGFTPTVWRLSEKPRYLIEAKVANAFESLADLSKKLRTSQIIEINKYKTALHQAALK